MSIYMYGEYNHAALAEEAVSAQATIVLDGDCSGYAWLQATDTVKLIEGTVIEEAIVSTNEYSSGDDETTITFTSNLSHTFSTDGEVIGFAHPIMKVDGFLEGNAVDTSFSVGVVEPSEVRSYKASTPWGTLLSSGTDYSYNAGLDEIELAYTPTVGETVVAMGSGEWLLNSDYLAVGLNTLVERDIYIFADSDYDCLYIGMSEWISGDVNADWFSLGKEVSEDTWEWYHYQTICNINTGSIANLKIRFNLINSEAEVHNYYNVPILIGHLQMPVD